MKIKLLYINQISELTNRIDSSIRRLGLVTYNKLMMMKLLENLILELKTLNTNKDTLVDLIYKEYGNGYIDPNTWQFIPAKVEEQTQLLTVLLTIPQTELG